LKLQYVEPLSNFAFKFNLRLYETVSDDEKKEAMFNHIRNWQR